MLEHGGRLRRAAEHYGIALADWMDLSTGISPWAYPVPPVPEAVWQRLPEDDDGLDDAAARYYGSAELLAVAGSQPMRRRRIRLGMWRGGWSGAGRLHEVGPGH